MLVLHVLLTWTTRDCLMVARRTLPELSKTLMVAIMEVGGVASLYAVGARELAREVVTAVRCRRPGPRSPTTSSPTC